MKLASRGGLGLPIQFGEAIVSLATRLFPSNRLPTPPRPRFIPFLPSLAGRKPAAAHSDEVNPADARDLARTGRDQQ